MAKFPAKRKTTGLYKTGNLVKVISIIVEPMQPYTPGSLGLYDTNTSF